MKDIRSIFDTLKNRKKESRPESAAEVSENAVPTPLPYRYIYAIYDSSLTKEDIKILRTALMDLESLFPKCRIRLLGNAPFGPSKEFSGDGMISGAANEEGRLNADIIMQNMRLARRSLDNQIAFLFFTTKDLFLGSLKLNWCFGAAWRSLKISIQSLYRYKRLSKEDALRCLKRTLRHELAHLFYMATDARRTNTEERHGRHCTNPGCSCRQTGTLTELLTLSKEEDEKGFYFCDQCKADMDAFFKRNGL